MNNCDGGHNKYLVDSGFLPLIAVMRRTGFMSVDVVLVSIVIVCMRIITMGNIYIVNK